MRNATVQKRAFPLAGLMYANVNVQGVVERAQNETNCDVYHLPVNFESGTCVRTYEAGITVPANASPSFSRRGDEDSFETSTRVRESEFSESIKKDLPTIASPVYGYSAPAKSGAGIGLSELIKAIHDAPSVFFCVVSSVHLFFSGAGIIRVAHKIMVGCAGASSEAPGSLITGKTNSAQSTTNKIGLFGGGYIPLIKEAAAMLATTPTQNPQFIWLIAAVRRDMPTITAKIHHISAESEREARRILARDHVCFFAGRIRQEVSHA